MKALGFRTEVAVEDCLSLLQHWGSSNQAFEARCEVDADCVAVLTADLYSSWSRILLWIDDKHEN
jgi:hypothetical protein